MISELTNKDQKLIWVTDKKIFTEYLENSQQLISPNSSFPIPFSVALTDCGYIPPQALAPNFVSNHN